MTSFLPLLNKGWRLWVASLIFLGISVQAVSAHQLKSAQTTIQKNDRSGTLELMHRFSLHDAEHAMGLLFDFRGDIQKDKALQQKFAAYAASHFSLTVDGKALPLTLLGIEFDGNYLWLYQETPLSGLKNQQKITVKQSVLQDVWKNQLNLVNLEGFGPVQSYISRLNKNATTFELK